MGFGQSYIYLCQSVANTIVKWSTYQIKIIPLLLFLLLKQFGLYFV